MQHCKKGKMLSLCFSLYVFFQEYFCLSKYKVFSQDVFLNSMLINSYNAHIPKSLVAEFFATSLCTGSTVIGGVSS